MKNFTGTNALAYFIYCLGRIKKFYNVDNRPPLQQHKKGNLFSSFLIVIFLDIYGSDVKQADNQST
jgi:hypothetical protein